MCFYIYFAGISSQSIHPERRGFWHGLSTSPLVYYRYMPEITHAVCISEGRVRPGAEGAATGRHPPAAGLRLRQQHPLQERPVLLPSQGRYVRVRRRAGAVGWTLYSERHVTGSRSHPAQCTVRAPRTRGIHTPVTVV